MAESGGQGEGIKILREEGAGLPGHPLALVPLLQQIQKGSAEGGSGWADEKLPFFRTPKQVGRSSLWYAFQAAREEVLMGGTLLASAYFAAKIHGNESREMLVWVLVLTVLSTPYLASFLMSLISACPRLPARLIRRSYEQGGGQPPGEAAVDQENADIHQAGNRTP